MRRRLFLIGGLSVAAAGKTGATPEPSTDTAGVVDVAALATIRPGMPKERLRAAMGAAWREPAPNRRGKVDFLENTHGFSAWLDTGGDVGLVTYNYRFPQRIPIDGLMMGMTPEAAQAAMPTLQIGADKPLMPGVRMGSRRYPDGISLGVKFTLGTINEIFFSSRKAEYAPVSAPAYPAAGSKPGAPFADPNFKLAVMSALLDAKALDLGTPQQLAEHVLGRPVHLEKEGYELIPAARDYLVRYPLDDELLEKVETISFDGGNEIYRYVFYFWDGEDEGFDVASIAGIEKCINITSFSAKAIVGPVDLRELVPLKRLRELDLWVGIRHPEALLEMRALHKVVLAGNELYEEVMVPGSSLRAIMLALKERDVQVGVIPVSWNGPGRPPPFK